MKPGGAHRRTVWGICVFLAAAVWFVFSPTAHYEFINYDDDAYVYENPTVQNGLTWTGVKWAFATWHAGNWHPLTWLSHMADCQLAGLNPAWPHCENVLWHAANAVLLFALLLRLTGLIWPGAFAAALFAWHPLHVESVAWIAERKDVLSTFFALLALLAYTKHVAGDKWQVTRTRSAPTATVPPVTCHRSPFYWLALLFFALGLMAKPMLVTLPFVLLLLDYWPLQRISNRKSQIANPSARQPPTLNIQLSTVLEKLPFFALAAASCVVTFLAQHHGGAVATLTNVPLHYRLENASVAYAVYLLKMVWPAHLAVFYPLHPCPPLETAAAVAALVGISGLVWRVRRACPYWLVGWLWFLGTLVPVIGLVQVGAAAWADRYTYFPSIGIFLAVALGVRDGVERFRLSKPMAGSIAGVVLVGCLAFTHRQLNFWKDGVTLFSHALAVTKSNETAHLNLGYALEKAGRKPEAMDQYRAALKLDPNRAETHNNIANLLHETGQPDAAAAEYQEALRLNPAHIPSRDNYGTLLVELGRLDEAIKQFAEAARLDPTDWHPPYLTGKVLLNAGRDPEAIPHFRQAVQLDPDNPRVLTYLAQVLASDENPQVRNGNAALAMAAKANDLTGGAQPAMIDAMAMAYAEIGRFGEAQEAATNALKLATVYGMTNDVALIQQRLQLYQNHRPFRQSFLSTNALSNGLPKN